MNQNDESVLRKPESACPTSHRIAAYVLRFIILLLIAVLLSSLIYIVLAQRS